MKVLHHFIVSLFCSLLGLDGDGGPFFLLFWAHPLVRSATIEGDIESEVVVSFGPRGPPVCLFVHFVCSFVSVDMNTHRLQSQQLGSVANCSLADSSLPKTNSRAAKKPARSHFPGVGIGALSHTCDLPGNHAPIVWVEHCCKGSESVQQQCSQSRVAFLESTDPSGPKE